MSFRANPGERLFQARAPSALEGPRLYIAILGACLIHAGVLSYLIFDFSHEPVEAPATQEIPVDIVAEPPPPPPPPPPPQQQPQQPEPPSATRPLDEDPAFDAPRAANKEKVERDASGTASTAPSAATPAAPASAASAAGGTAGPMQEGELRASENSAEPKVDKPDAETITPSEPDPDREKSDRQEAHADKEVPPPKLPSLIGEPFPAWSSGQKLPPFESLPDVELAGAADATPIDGGKAKATYLTIIYGLVMSHMHMPPAVDANAPRYEGEIVFDVDGTGNLTQRRVVRASGLRELDAAALDAVKQAAPFPPPPQGAPLGLRFSYSAR